MEELYHAISKAINIDSNRRQYTELYDFVRNSVIKGLRENEIFNILFADLSLCGSYADNLKVTKPDEFDLVVRLEFPYHDEVYLEEDLVNLGNVWINLVNVIHKVARIHPKKEILLKFLNGITNDSGYLLLDKFQSWFEGLLTRYLLKIEKQLVYDGNRILLRYIKQGPAHTLLVKANFGEISIDIVPGFRFVKSQSISPRSELIQSQDKWEAIPKPYNGQSSNPSFQCSYTESERRLLAGRNQFKNALRMMKKFRDMNPALVNLKSYYIKTLFLWHNNSVDPDHWNTCNTTIMDTMFEELEKALQKRKLPFFWDERVNLFRFLSQNQINTMYHEVKNARKILSKRNDLAISDLSRIKNLFLTEDDQDQIPLELEQEIQKSFWQLTKEKVEEYSDYLPWVGAAAVVAVLGFAFFRNRNNNNN